MKLFICEFDGGRAIVSAFNRGHAVKILAKKLESETPKRFLNKSDKVEEIEFTDKKGKVILFD